MDRKVLPSESTAKVHNCSHVRIEIRVIGSVVRIGVRSCSDWRRAPGTLSKPEFIECRHREELGGLLGMEPRTGSSGSPRYGPARVVSGAGVILEKNHSERATHSRGCRLVSCLGPQVPSYPSQDRRLAFFRQEAASPASQPYSVGGQEKSSWFFIKNFAVSRRRSALNPPTPRSFVLTHSES